MPISISKFHTGVMCPRCGNITPVAGFPAVPSPTVFCSTCGLSLKTETLITYDPKRQSPAPVYDETYGLVQSIDRYPQLNLDSVHPDLSRAISAFHVNRDRVLAIIMFPMFVASQAPKLDQLYAQAAINCGIDLKESTPDQAVATRLRAEFIRLSELYVTGPHNIREEKWAGRTYLDLISAFAGKTQPDMGPVALLASGIIGTWTMFESLAESLWVQCLNARPRLGLKALDVEILATDNEDDVFKKTHKKIPIPHWMLFEKDFKINERMGDLLKAKNDWDFARRDQAADAYSSTFGKEVQELKDIFKGDETNWLANVRNSLIHDGGIIDAEFARKMKSHPHFKYAQVNQPLNLNGPVVKELITGGFRQSVALITYVSKWLKENPI